MQGERKRSPLLTCLNSKKNFLFVLPLSPGLGGVVLLDEELLGGGTITYSAACGGTRTSSPALDLLQCEDCESSADNQLKQ